MNRSPDPTPTLVTQLAQLATSCTIGSLPPEVVASVPQRVLDILGICVRATTLETSAGVLDLVEETGGRPAATAIGLADRVPVAAAAFVNGVLAHSLDADDTHLPSVLHPSASVVPAALATAESSGASGAAVVAAIAAGLEITVRLGMAGYDPATRQSMFFEHGQHATSICGAIGSAAASSVLLGGATEEVAHSMAVACSMASGILEANRTGGTVKRLHCGFAAQAGVTAAQLVSRGITGAPTSLEGRFGFFEAWLRDEWRAAAITEGLGTEWNVAGIFYKPYPANHFTHAAIDAGLRFRAHGVSIADITGIRLGVATPTVRTIGEPIETKRCPDTGYQAQFSGPYAVVAALLGGSGLGLGLDDFTDELAQDRVRRELMAKVVVEGDERCDAIYPSQFPAIVTLTFTDGSTATEEVLVNRGGPGDPLSAAELAQKFTDNTDGILAPTDAETVAIGCSGLTRATGVGELMSPLRKLAR